MSEEVRIFFAVVTTPESLQEAFCKAKFILEEKVLEKREVRIDIYVKPQ